jgi:hypothetical protein
MAATTFLLRCVLSIAGLALLCGAARAGADGPDHYRVSGIASDAELVVRAEPSQQSPRIASLPPQTQCLRNLGCQGGLTLQEFSTLGKAEQQERQLANPRWCQIAYPGGRGWVEGRFLIEAACVGHHDQPVVPISFQGATGSRLIKGRLQGHQTVDYQFTGRAGQILAVSLGASNGQHYFNVNPPGSEVSMYVGSSSGNQFVRQLPSDGIYTVRSYLMRAAARRNESSRYSLRIKLSGKPLAALPAHRDALIPGTPYHASATLPCAHDATTPSRQCEAFVIRRSVAGDATLEIRWPAGAPSPLRRILFIKGLPVSSDAAEPVTHTRQGDVTSIRIGEQESVAVPDALIIGG